MDMGRVATGRPMRKGTPTSDTPMKKRKLAQSTTGSSPGVVFAAVSFASPEKTEKGDIDTSAVIMRKKEETGAHSDHVHSADVENHEVDETNTTHDSSRSVRKPGALPTSMFIPNSPHPDLVVSSSQRNQPGSTDESGPNSYSQDHESPSILQSLLPRKDTAQGGANDIETLPSLCSSTSGLQSESSPESERIYDSSNVEETLRDRSVEERLLPKCISSPMKIPISSPKPSRDEVKTSFRSDRNVTFSPVPAVKYHYFDDSHGRLHNKASTEQHPMATSSVVPKATPSGLSLPLSSDGVKSEESQTIYQTEFEGNNSEELQERTRDGGITPTNFAFDYGKIELTSSFDGANELSWLQTPTGNMFSPGGLAVSTPLLNVLFFPEGPSHLPSPRHNMPGDSKIMKEQIKSENNASHPFNNVICVSPLASSKNTSSATAQAHKAQNSLNSINFKEVFASPKIYHETASSDAKVHRNSSTIDAAAQQKCDIYLDFHIAERDIMEDDDLNLLRNLAQSTPKEITLEERSSHPSMKYGGKASVFRGSPRIREKLPVWKQPPSSLQMPLIKYPSEMPISNAKKASHNSSRKGKKQVLPIGNVASADIVEPRMVSVQHGSSPGQPSIIPGGYYPPSYGHFSHPHHMGMPPPQYRFSYPHPHHAYGMFPNQVATNISSRGNVVTDGRSKGDNKRPSIERLTVGKTLKKSAPKLGTNQTLSGTKRVKAPSSQSNTAERPKPAAILSAIDSENGTKLDKAAALAAAIMRGVTMRPSGKWQAQLYYAGKSRYIGVFDTREKAALAYEIAREQLKTDRPIEPGSISLKETEANVNAARQAAFDGVNEADSKLAGGT